MSIVTRTKDINLIPSWIWSWLKVVLSNIERNRLSGIRFVIRLVSVIEKSIEHHWPLLSRSGGHSGRCSYVEVASIHCRFWVSRSN